MTASRFSQRTQYLGPQTISDLMGLALARPELISLAAGFVDQESLPVDETRAAMEALLAEPPAGRAALQYGTNAGYRPLREALLERFIAADGPQAATVPAIEQLVLTAGSNQMLHLVGEALLDPGDIVLCAAPCYFVFLGILRNLGARSVGVAIDSQGMCDTALEEQLRQLERAGELPRVKAIYSTSYFENPSTVTLGAARRASIVEIAKRWSRQGPIYVIDDSAYRLLRYAGDDVPSMRAVDEDGSTVIVAETFSKSFSPGVRVGWGILPTPLVAPILGMKANIDFGSPNFNQHLMAKVLERGLFDTHVEALRRSYRLKLDAMLSALDESMRSIAGVRWHVPTGGLYVWLELPEGVEAGPGGTLMERALKEGMIYVPGEYCYPAEGERCHKNRIRLSFGVQTAENIGRGVHALARAIKQSQASLLST